MRLLIRNYHSWILLLSWSLIMMTERFLLLCVSCSSFFLYLNKSPLKRCIKYSNLLHRLFYTILHVEKRTNTCERYESKIIYWMDSVGQKLVYLDYNHFDNYWVHAYMYVCRRIIPNWARFVWQTMFSDRVIKLCLTAWAWRCFTSNIYY